jgi:hypothetical protein
VSLEVHVSLVAGDARSTGLCLIDGPSAAVDLPDLDEPVLLPTAMVPARLAALVELGPRPRVAAPGCLVLSEVSLDRLAGGVLPDELPPAWAGPLAAVAAGLRRRWCIVAGSADGAPVDALEVLDAGAAGLWAVHPCPAELVTAEGGAGQPMVLLAPATATEVWTWLSRLATV